MILSTTHKLWWAEVESRDGSLSDPRYTLRSITPGVAWREVNMRLQRQSTGVDLVPAEPGDPVLVKNFNGSVKAYGWTGIPFDPCDDGKVQGGDKPKGFFASIPAAVAAIFGLGGSKGPGSVGGVGSATATPSLSTTSGGHS